MWRLPAMEVGAYAEKDAELNFRTLAKFKKIIIEDDLQDIFNLETDLFPCLVDMRHLGVRVDDRESQSIENSTGNKRRKPITTNKNRNRSRTSDMGSKKYCQSF